MAQEVHSRYQIQSQQVQACNLGWLAFKSKFTARNIFLKRTLSPVIAAVTVRAPVCVSASEGTDRLVPMEVRRQRFRGQVSSPTLESRDQTQAVSLARHVLYP